MEGPLLLLLTLLTLRIRVSSYLQRLSHFRISDARGRSLERASASIEASASDRSSLSRVRTLDEQNCKRGHGDHFFPPSSLPSAERIWQSRT